MANYKSPSYYIYFDAHTRLNNYIKIATAAVNYLYESNSDPEQLAHLIDKLIQNAEERWTEKVIKNPQSELDQLRNDLAKTGIIWVYSAFDVYFKQMEGILSDRFPKKLNNKNNEDDNPKEEKESRIVNLYNKLQWPLDNIKELIPVVKFYDLLRHCVAHNMGLPNENLVEQSKDELFIHSIDNWKTKFKGKKISPPPIVTDTMVELKAHHAIHYSDACLRITVDVDEKMYKTLGLNYFIIKTIKRHLKEANNLTEPHCQNLQRYIAFHLHKDHNICIDSFDQIDGAYTSEDDLQTDREKYAKLKNNKSKTVLLKNI